MAPISWIRLNCQRLEPTTNRLSMAVSSEKWNIPPPRQETDHQQQHHLVTIACYKAVRSKESLWKSLEIVCIIWGFVAILIHWRLIERLALNISPLNWSFRRNFFKIAIFFKRASQLKWSWLHWSIEKLEFLICW